MGFIFSVLARRLQLIFNRINKDEPQKPRIESGTTGDNETPIFFNVPYVRNYADRFKHATRDLDIKMSYTGLNKLNCFIKVQKDRLNKDKKTGVVYKINCGDCDASYVGQTKRLLKTRGTLKTHK